MSVAEIADYVSFRLARRDLGELVDWYPTIDADSQLRYFKRAERGLAGIRVYPEISGMEESGRALDAAIAGKETTSWFSGGRRKRIAAEMRASMRPVLRTSDKLVGSRLPPRNQAARDKVASVIKRFYALGDMPAIPEGKSVYRDADEIFLGPTGTWYSTMAGVLSETKAVDPLSEAENPYQDALAFLYPEKDADDVRQKIENLTPARASIDALFGIIKPYYNIADEEVFDQSGNQQLEAAYRRIFELGQALDSATRGITLLPKHIGDLDELAKLQKELMADVGANRPVSDMKIIVDKSVRTLEVIVLAGLGDEGLDQRKRTLLTDAYDLSTELGGMKRDILLDDTHKELVKNYSFELLELIKSKEPRETSPS